MPGTTVPGATMHKQIKGENKEIDGDLRGLRWEMLSTFLYV